MKNRTFNSPLLKQTGIFLKEKQMTYQTILRGFLDENGKIKQLPSKRDKRQAALNMIGGKFEPGKSYNEKEVNEIIKNAISFSDHETTRRELISMKILERTADGSSYWRTAAGQSSMK